jgi:hypothetical protein
LLVIGTGDDDGLVKRRLLFHPFGEARRAKRVAAGQHAGQVGGLVKRVVADATLEEGGERGGGGGRRRETLALVGSCRHGRLTHQIGNSPATEKTFGNNKISHSNEQTNKTPTLNYIMHILSITDNQGRQMPTNNTFCSCLVEKY